MATAGPAGAVFWPSRWLRGLVAGAEGGRAAVAPSAREAPAVAPAAAAPWPGW